MGEDVHTQEGWMQHKYKQRSAFTCSWKHFESLFEGLSLKDWCQFVAGCAGSKKHPSDFGSGFYFCPGPWNSPNCSSQKSVALISMQHMEKL